MTSTSAPATVPPNPFPSQDLPDFPGCILARSGVYADLPAAAFDLGELGLITDKWWGILGDTSQNPAVWPTSKTVGGFDWTLLNPFFDNINVRKINGQDLKDFFEDFITSGTTPVITIINEVLTKTVYGPNADFFDLDEAYAWLSQRTISTRGSVTLVFPVGVITDTKTYVINHPNGDRIFWQGGALKTPMPPATSFQVTDNTPAAQANDALANLALIRQSFSTELRFTNGGQIFFTGDLASINNIMFTSDSALGAKASVDGLVVSGGSVVFNNVATVGFDFRGVLVQSGSLQLASGSSFFSFNNGVGVQTAINSLFGITGASIVTIGNGGRHVNDYQGSGIAISDNSLVASYQYYTDNSQTIVRSSGNVGHGVFLDAKSTLSGRATLTCRKNGVSGMAAQATSTVSLTAPGTFSDNAQFGVSTNLYSSIFIPPSNINNNAQGVGAYNYSFVATQGSNVSGNQVNYTPAQGQLGNTNSLIT